MSKSKRSIPKGLELGTTGHHCRKPVWQDILFRNCMEVRFLTAVTIGSYFSPLRSPFNLLRALGKETLLEQRLHKILCTVYKLVNYDTNPESLMELANPAFILFNYLNLYIIALFCYNYLTSFISKSSFYLLIFYRGMPVNYLAQFLPYS